MAPVIKAGVVGASGYAGGELVRILSRHPQVKLACVSSGTHAGRQIGDVFASMWGRVDLVCEDLSPEEVADRCDVVFTAVPHGAAMPFAPAVKRAGGKMIDLGADFRFGDAGLYELWYKVKHQCPGFLAQAVYGLSELNRKRIAQAWLVGNPGCYPTTVLLGLAPVMAAGAADPKGIIVDSKSGVSGAGRKPGLTYHFPERNDSLTPYGVPGHRHTPEIEQELTKLAGSEATITFTPHLVPQTRGMLSTIYVPAAASSARGPLIPSEEELAAIYRDFYKDEYFVRILPPDRFPETGAVCGSNFCDIAVRVDKHAGRIIVMSAIDNLVKGASGQAVQNMNIMFGVDERLGIDSIPLFP